MWIYVGTYTNRTGRGIYGLDFDETAGTFGEPRLVVETPNASFLAINTTADRLYATVDPGEIDGEKAGGVAAFALDTRDKSLTPLARKKTGRGGACFVDVSVDGRFVAAADYGAAQIDLVAVRGDGFADRVATATHRGSGPDASRQQSSHAHCAKFDPSGRYLIACDLGTDETYVYRVRPDGTDGPALERAGVHKAAPGAGPRHVAFGRDRRVLYVVNELNNTVDALRWDGEAGTLTHEQTVPTLPPAFTGRSTASEVVVHPSGAFVYAANRGHNSVAVFHVDRDTGRLSVAGHTPTQGDEPRHFNVTPTGRHLIVANQNSDSLVAFAVDKEQGTLTPTGGTASVSRPACVRFVN